MRPLDSYDVRTKVGQKTGAACTGVHPSKIEHF